MNRALAIMLVGFCFTLFSQSPGGFGAEPTKEPLARAKKLVLGALKYECKGETDFRNIMLREALKSARDYPPANWYAGRSLTDDGWLSVEEVQRIASTDETIAKYRELRARGADDVKTHLNLGRWCARVGLQDRSQLHFTALLRDPQLDEGTRREAMRKLNLQYAGGELLTDKQLKQRREVAKQIERAMKKWRPKLEGWRKVIEGGNDRKSEFAVRQMHESNDPYLVPVLETFLFESGERFGTRIVQLLGRFDHHEATQSLVRYSVMSPWPSARSAAIDQLKKRPIHDFMPMLVAGLDAPIQSQWRIYRDAQGNIRYHHATRREGRSEIRSTELEHVALNQGAQITRNITGGMAPKPGFRRQIEDKGVRDLQSTGERQLAALSALAQAAEREKQLEQYNRSIQQSNSRVFDVLERTTGAAVARSPVNWWFWWEQFNETVKPKKRNHQHDRTVSAFTSYTGTRDFDVRYIEIPPHRGSCFVVGTKVWAETGLVAIEDIRLGDRVLAQDPNSGELTFNLVTQTTNRIPTAGLVKLNIDGEQILATKGHVFWVAGKGWRMAKRLEIGDQIHGVSGGLRVEEMEERPAPKRVYNLVIQDFHTYFVGESGALVHDITYRRPTRAVIPGYIPAMDAKENQ